MGRASGSFSEYHPAVVGLFILCAVVLGMSLQHPAFACASVLLASVTCAWLRRRAAVGFLVGALLVVVVVTMVNPVFNTMGSTVLFTYAQTRPYTLEALCAGLSTAVMLASMLLWFAVCNALLTTEKLHYLFSHLAPSASLLLAMSLRLVPRYKHRAVELECARACVGKAARVGSLSSRVRGATRVLSMLTTCALEEAAIQADSMRSRGYGLAGRTSYARFRFDRRNAATCAVMAACGGIVVACAVFGATAVSFFPVIEVAEFSSLQVVGLVAYVCFLSVPLAIDLGAALSWRLSLSSI